MPASQSVFLRQDPGPAPEVPSVLLVRVHVVILINYVKLINFVVGDILKMSADNMYTTARDFGTLTADVTAINKFIMDSKPEMSAKSIDDGTWLFIVKLLM